MKIDSKLVINLKRQKSLSLAPYLNGIMITCEKTRIIVLLSLLLTLSGLFALSEEAFAAPDDRGSMGGVYAFALGGVIITGEDEEGNRLHSHYGGSAHLMLGEEVLPRLFVGIGIDAHLDTLGGEPEPSLSQLFAFGLEGRYRLSAQSSGLLFIGGIGIGAGGFASQGESVFSSDDSSGGSVWKLGLGYELGGDGGSGMTYIPRLLFQRLGPQMESSVGVNAISFGLELLYASGRQSKSEDE